MFIPYNSDAPLYHYPVATVCMIVVNVILFAAFCLNIGEDLRANRLTDLVQHQDLIDQLKEQAKADPKMAELLSKFEDTKEVAEDGPAPISTKLVLQLGSGLKPWQWLTSMFMHAGIIHLLGNMIFLWAFGLVIEGKVGPWLFSVIYLGSGVTQSMIEQILMLSADESVSLGASSAIFALLAIAVIWAPSNSFEVVLWLGFRPLFLEVPISIFGLIMFAFNFVPWAWSGGMTSEALHLMGLVVGIPIGLVMLNQHWVDCEGFDIISYFRGKEGEDSAFLKKKKTKSSKKTERERVDNQEQTKKQQQLLELQVGEAISQGNWDVAVALQKKLTSITPQQVWQATALRQVISGYLKNKQYDKAVPLLELYIEHFHADSFGMQIILMKIWLQQQRPRHALRFMKCSDLSLFSAEQQNQIRQLASQAKRQVDDGVLEVE